MKNSQRVSESFIQADNRAKNHLIEILILYGFVFLNVFLRTLSLDSEKL